MGGRGVRVGGLEGLFGGGGGHGWCFGIVLVESEPALIVVMFYMRGH